MGQTYFFPYIAYTQTWHLRDIMGEYVLSLSKLFLGNHIFPWLPLNSIFFYYWLMSKHFFYVQLLNEYVRKSLNAWFHTTCTSDIKGVKRKYRSNPREERFIFCPQRIKMNACIRTYDPVWKSKQFISNNEEGFS